MPETEVEQAGPRHPLVFYHLLYRSWRNAALLIAIFTAILWWFAPGVPWLNNPVLDNALLIGAGLSALLFVFTLLAPRFCYFQCQVDRFYLSVAFFQLAISYQRIRSVRPANYAPQKLSGGEKEMLRNFIGKTAVELELSSFPMGEKTLRFWLNQRLFAEKVTGLVLLTDDWMSLGQEIDGFRQRWLQKKRGPTGAGRFTYTG